MAWVQVDVDLRDHPKTGRLARRLGISRAEAMGTLVLLWSWVVKYAPDGELGSVDAAEIAEGVLFQGEPDALLDALVQAGFLERDEEGTRVHDWLEYSGKLDLRRQAHREQQREYRSRQASPSCDEHVISTCEARDNHVTMQSREEEIRGEVEVEEMRGDAVKASSASASSLLTLAEEGTKAWNEQRLGRWFAEHVEWINPLVAYLRELGDEVTYNEYADASQALYFANWLAPVLVRWKELTHRPANAAEIELFTDCLNSGAYIEEVLLPALNEAATSTDRLNAKFVVAIAARMAGVEWEPRGTCRDIHPRLVEVDR